MCDFRKRKGILNRIEICDDFLAIYVREVSICGLEYKGCKEYPAIMGTESLPSSVIIILYSRM